MPRKSFRPHHTEHCCIYDRDSIKFDRSRNGNDHSRLALKPDRLLPHDTVSKKRGTSR